MNSTLTVVGARIAGKSRADRFDVRLEGQKIAGISPAGSTVIGAAFDAQGLTLFPGLIDAHVHLCFSPESHPEQALPSYDDEELLDLVRRHGRNTLEHGVTTVRDLGSRGDVVRRYARDVEQRREFGPRVVASGPVLTRAEGHCHYVGDVIPAGADPSNQVDGHHLAGDDWVKVMVTGGALTSTSSPEARQFNLEETQSIVGSAHELGMRVAAHTLTREGAAIAITAGVDSLEHGVDVDDVALTEMAKRGITLVPVLSPSARTLARDPSGEGEHAARLRDIVGRLHGSTHRAIGAGVRIIAGTDAGCPDVPHGAALVDELILLEKVGLARADVLRAATDRAADALGLADSGRISVGARADLLLLDGDPYEELEVLRVPRAVIAAGRIATHTLS